MKEHIIFDKIELYEKAVETRPISLLPNLLLLSYVALGKQYEKLASYSEQFLMSNPRINILVEDFIMLSNLATNQQSFADISFRNIHSLDPEEPYSHLLRLITESSPEDFMETKIFLGNNHKELADLFNNVEITAPYNLYRIPEVIGLKDNIISKIRKTLEETPANPILRVSLAEALLKTNQVEEAQKEIDTVISIYPNYTRALHIKAKLYQDYLEEEAKGIEIYKKIFELNPVSPYLKGIEVVFLSEDESIMVSELKTIFRHDNPFVLYFKENFKKKENEQKTETSKKEKAVKEEPINKKKNIEIIEEPELSPLDEGYKHLYQGNHKKAIESFLKDLKKK